MHITRLNKKCVFLNSDGYEIFKTVVRKEKKEQLANTLVCYSTINKLSAKFEMIL